METRTTFLVALVAVFAAACASIGGPLAGGAFDADPASLYLTRWQPPDGQQCSLSTGDLPRFRAVFDSVAAAREMEALAERGVEGAVVVRVHVGKEEPEEGEEPGQGEAQVVTLEALESSLSDADAERVLERLRARVLPEVEATALLRVDTRPPGFRFGPGFSCAPAIRNRSEIELLAGDAGRSGLSGRAIVRIRVHESGAVDSVFVHQSSGFVATDAAAVRIALRMSYHPAIVNRRPVQVWVQVPISITDPD